MSDVKRDKHHPAINQLIEGFRKEQPAPEADALSEQLAALSNKFDTNATQHLDKPPIAPAEFKR